MLDPEERRRVRNRESAGVRDEEEVTRLAFVVSLLASWPSPATAVANSTTVETIPVGGVARAYSFEGVAHIDGPSVPSVADTRRAIDG